MPTDRRVVFSSYVVPTRSDTMEEDAFSKETFISSPGSTLGGKGTASITASQWNDGWTSMYHPGNNKVNWEELDDNTDVSGDRWEDVYTTWSGVFLILSPTQLTPTLADVPMKFLYIKNVDDTYKAYVRLGSIPDTFNGTDDYYNAFASGYDEDYKIQISPGASICLRGDGTDLDCDAVDVNTEDGPNGTKIEYIIAK